MKFTLTIDVDNDAFQPDPYAETAAILRSIAGRIEDARPPRSTRRGPEDENRLGDYANGAWTGHFQTVLDSNGNDVGRYAFKPDAYFQRR